MVRIKFMSIVLFFLLPSCKVVKFTVDDCESYPVTENIQNNENQKFEVSSDIDCDYLKISFNNYTSKKMYVFSNFLCQKSLEFNETFLIQDSALNTLIIDLSITSKLKKLQKEKTKERYMTIYEKEKYSIDLKLSELLKKQVKDKKKLVIRLNVFDENEFSDFISYPTFEIEVKNSCDNKI